MTPWKPKEQDLEWMRKMIRILKDGGYWGIPATGAVITFYKSRKEFTLEEAPGTHRILDIEYKNSQNIAVLETLGWKRISTKNGDNHDNMSKM